MNNRHWAVGIALASETVMLQRVDQRILIFFQDTVVRQIDLGAQTCKGSPDNDL